jgi:hypothetical protein
LGQENFGATKHGFGNNTFVDLFFSQAELVEVETRVVVQEVPEVHLIS